MINEFRGEYEFLSNFYHYSFYWHGHRYPTAEHAFQSAKTLDPGVQRSIRGAASPAMAKRAGRQSPLRPGWQQMKKYIMLDILLAKFHSDPMRSQLLSTAGQELVEGNWWHDNEWGNCLCAKCKDIPGHNELGDNLTVVRLVLTPAEEGATLPA